MDDLFGLVFMLLLLAVVWTFAMLIPVVLAALALLGLLWVGWAFFDRWWSERKVEHSKPSPVRDQRA